MSDVRGTAAIPNHLEPNENKIEHVARVMSRGIMIGAAISLPVMMRHENIVYGLL